MDLVERTVEGLSCGLLLAPKGWTLRVHHDVYEDSSLNVAHFWRVGISKTFLYVAEHFVRRDSAAGREPSMKKTLQNRLITHLTQIAGGSQTPFWCVWEVTKSVEGATQSPLAALLDEFVLLLYVVLFVVDCELVDAEMSFNRIVDDLKGRYTCALKERETAGNVVPWAVACSGVYTSRGRSVIQLVRRVGCSIQWCPTTCARGDWLQDVVAKELHLESENLRFSICAACPVVVALLPLSPGVSLLSHCAMRRVWMNHVEGSGWCCEKVMQVSTSLPDLTSSLSSPLFSCAITPRSTFYLLVKEKSVVEEGVVAWVTEPRVGGDSCVVLLTPLKRAEGEVALTTDACREQCEWILSRFHVSVSTAASWTVLSFGKEPGFLFREGNLVVQIPSKLPGYEDATATSAAAISSANGVSLGSITVAAGVVGKNSKRQVTVTLLEDFRSAEEYVDYVITEYLYDIPLERKLAVFRKRRTKQAMPPSGKDALGKEEEYSFWISLGDRGAVYYMVRESGIGRLLLMQASVLGIAFGDTIASMWETWVSGIGIAVIP